MNCSLLLKTSFLRECGIYITFISNTNIPDHTCVDDIDISHSIYIISCNHHIMHVEKQQQNSLITLNA